MSSSHANILDVPNKILLKIFKEAKNDSNLSLTCLRFNELISKIHEKNVSLEINHFNLINPMFDLDSHIKASNISLNISYDCRTLSNIDDKIELFLREHGERVTKLSYIWIDVPITVKFLQMLPNLDELELFGPFSFDSTEFEGFSKRVRKLTVEDVRDLSFQDVFSFDELDVKFLQFTTQQLFLPRNLKKLKLTECLLTESMHELELESFDFDYFYCNSPQDTGDFLRSQTKLKELYLRHVEQDDWTIVCNHLEKLELMHIEFIYGLKAPEFGKISNLKSLKTLRIGANCFNQFDNECFDELTKIKFGNLESLHLSLEFSPSASDFENLAVNFANIKSLSLFMRSLTSRIISKVLEKFNRLESLKLHGAIDGAISKEISFGSTDEAEIFFNAQDHKNPHLKSLDIKINLCNLGSKLIPKFVRDFPNLETIGLYGGACKREHFELLMTGFKNLRKVENLWIENDELFSCFLKHRKSLDALYVNINSLDDPNEVLEGFDISFGPNFDKFKLTRSGQPGHEVDFYKFSHWQELRVLINSTRKLKHLTLDLARYKHKNCFIKYLRVIGESVTTLTLQHIESVSVLREILDTVPNIDTLIIKNSSLLYDERKDTTAWHFSKQLESVELLDCIKYEKYYKEEDVEREIDRLQDFFHFADDSLVSFFINTYSRDVDHQKIILQIFEKMLKNQRKLTKKSVSTKFHR